MKKRLLSWALAFLCLILLFGALPAGAQARDILMNERISVKGDGNTYAYTFSPAANNLYHFTSFGSGQARASLYLAGEEAPIAQGEGFDFSARLIADETYTLHVSCQGGDCQVEIMRQALGRCFAQPIELTDLSQGYAKAIARAYDTHWYRFQAPEDGYYAIRSISDMNMVGHLLDEQGGLLQVSDNLYAPYEMDFCLEKRLSAGQVCLIRLSARGGETGRYQLSIAYAAQGKPLAETIVPSVETIALAEGEKLRLSYNVEPSGALDDAALFSADETIARVEENGLVTALSAGQTQIILRAAGGAQAQVQVNVSPIPVSGLRLSKEKLSLQVGQLMDVPCQVLPSNASNPTLTLTSSNPDVLTITARGQLAARSPGAAQVTISAGDGRFTASLPVTVEKAAAQYRVLAMGMQRFEGGDYRLGAVNTTQGVYDVFSRQRYDGSAPQVSMRLDLTRSQAISAMRTFFAGAQSQDVSILYINTHGGLSGRTPWIRFADDKILTARQLKKELDKIPGRVVLLMDCCQSGSFISTRAQRDFAGRMAQEFSSRAGSSMTSSKYLILTSTSSQQNSYRLLPSRDAAEGSCTTAFAQALCEGGGWDLISDSPMRLRADMDQDRQVSFSEVYAYLSSRVPQLLGRDDLQQVQAQGKGSPLPLFSR